MKYKIAPIKHATGCDVDFNKPCNCSSHPRYRQEILGKIHLAVRTEFFDRNRKNMEFLADDIEAWHKAERAKLFEQIRSEVIGEDEEMHRLNPSMNTRILQMVRESNYLADNQNKLRAEQREALTRLEQK